MGYMDFDLYNPVFFIYTANCAGYERQYRGAATKVLRGILRPNVLFRLNYIKKYDIILIYKRRIINDNKEM